MKRTLITWTSILAVAVSSCALAADDAKSGLKYSITVSKFENRAGWSGQWDIGDAWGSVMTDALQGSGKFIVLGEKDMRGEAMLEQDLAAAGRTAGGKMAPKTGQMTPAQLLVKGEITHVQSSTSGGGGGLNFKGIRLGGAKDTAEINATIYIVDSQTGQVKASTKVVGKAGRKGLGLGYSGSALGGLTGEFDGFKKDNVGKACEDAVGQAVEFLIKQLDTIPWTGSVVSASKGKIIVNRGSREGVTVGQAFTVGTLEITTDPDSGEVLDSSVTKVASIKAATVKEKISICEAVCDGSKIEKVMGIQPAE
jgi:curli biogenesis system outer membrane secretion channel CsgG